MDYRECQENATCKHHATLVAQDEDYGQFDICACCYGEGAQVGPSDRDCRPLDVTSTQPART